VADTSAFKGAYNYNWRVSNYNWWVNNYNWRVYTTTTGG
jgi:hypothetical protein